MHINKFWRFLKFFRNALSLPNKNPGYVLDSQARSLLVKASLNLLSLSTQHLISPFDLLSLWRAFDLYNIELTWTFEKSCQN